VRKQFALELLVSTRRIALNLATEYLIRHGIARDGLRLPCSVFTFHYLTYDKVVVTVDPSDKFYKVRRWYLNKAKSTEEMPPHEESVLIDKEALFTSDIMVAPEFKIIAYRETHYRQKSRIDPTNLGQEAEFHNLHIQFANSQMHKAHRRDWLWQAFVAVHGSMAKSFLEKWQKWVNFFDLDRAAGEISPDLVFAEAYEGKNGHYKESQVARSYAEEVAARDTPAAFSSGTRWGNVYQTFTYTFT
jgi:hypothetical protein